MGLLDFLSNKPTPSKIARATKRMLNEHHQQQVRQEALEELAAYGTPEAVASLVRRALGSPGRPASRRPSW